MTSVKQSLYETFCNSGDIRGLIQLIEQYDYTDDEASEVINNVYTPDEHGIIPEVEHIEVMLWYFPQSYVSSDTMNAIKRSYPWRVEHIINTIKTRMRQFLIRSNIYFISCT